MNFEKALEAMRNGKRVERKGWDSNYELCMFENTIISYPHLEHIPYLKAYDISACDWEICGEWLKEPEMTAGHAIKIKDAIEAIIKIKDAIEALGRDTEPEHKCNACQCNCSHTGKNSNLQEEMEQALSRKFFELEKYSDDESTVNSMLNIYNSIFSD